MSAASRPRADFTVASGQSAVVNPPQGPLKVGIQCSGSGTPTVTATMSPQADIDAATATWVAVTLTSGQAVIDNVFTAIKVAAASNSVKVAVVWN